MDEHQAKTAPLFSNHPSLYYFAGCYRRKTRVTSVYERHAPASGEISEELVLWHPSLVQRFTVNSSRWCCLPKFPAGAQTDGVCKQGEIQGDSYAPSHKHTLGMTQWVSRLQNSSLRMPIAQSAIYDPKSFTTCIKKDRQIAKLQHYNQNDGGCDLFGECATLKSQGHISHSAWLCCFDSVLAIVVVGNGPLRHSGTADKQFIFNDANRHDYMELLHRQCTSRPLNPLDSPAPNQFIWHLSHFAQLN